MSAHNGHKGMILTEMGQVVQLVTMVIDGVPVRMIPLSVAASRLNYSVTYCRILCDMDTLIGIKIESRWWVAELSVNCLLKHFV